MATTSEPVERRKNKRFLIHESAFVCFNRNPAMAARIVDASVGGLGFTYLASKRRTGDLFTVDMLCILCDLSQLAIPVRTISDFETTVEGVRRCDVQFVGLTKGQKHGVGRFIDCCATGEA